MAQTSERTALNGWLVIDKSAGHSSAAIVSKIKWLLNAKKVGHTGTLDPDATGVLVIALGVSTKMIPFLNERTKTYKFQLFFWFSN